MAPYLDVHLLLRLLHFVEENKVYPDEEVVKAKINVLSQTNMIEYAGDIYKQAHKIDTVPPEMEASKKALIETFNTVQQNSKKLVDLLKDSELLKNLQASNNFTFDHLSTNFGVTPEDVEALYAYAKFQFECGQYKLAEEFLGHYRSLLAGTLLSSPQQKQYAKKNVFALWGKLASEILSENWEQALLDVNLIRDAIEDPRVSETPIKLVENRVWLLHWSLFVFYHVPNGHHALLEFCLGNERYPRAIEMKAPWILRYLSVSAILTKNLQLNSQHSNTSNTGNSRLKELVKLVDQENCTYSDPITNFMQALYVKCDFDLAEQILESCLEVLTQDFFISTGIPMSDQSFLSNLRNADNSKNSLAHQFISEARVTICEAYCKIHNCINIDTMIRKLQGKSETNIPQQDAEKFIVNLIRNVKLNAKIDTAQQQVVVTSTVPSVYQMLLDRTKTMTLRAGVLASNSDFNNQHNQVQHLDVEEDRGKTTLPAFDDDYDE